MSKLVNSKFDGQDRNIFSGLMLKRGKAEFVRKTHNWIYDMDFYVLLARVSVKIVIVDHAQDQCHPQDDGVCLAIIVQPEHAKELPVRVTPAARMNGNMFRSSWFELRVVFDNPSNDRCSANDLITMLF